MEISSSSQRFGCILRDRNQNAFVCKNNLKAPAKDHHHRHELFRSSAASHENSENLVDSWIKTLNEKKDKPTVRKSRVIASTVEESVSRMEKCERNVASSLVQIWEARLNPSSGGNSPSHNQSTAASNRGDSGVSVQDSCFSESPSSNESGAENGDVEIESRSHGSVSDSGSGRVADLIKRLSNEKKLGVDSRSSERRELTSRPARRKARLVARRDSEEGKRSPICLCEWSGIATANWIGFINATQFLGLLNVAASR